MKTTLVAILALGVAAFGIYTFGWHKRDPSNRAIAEADVHAFITYINVANNPIDPTFHRVGAVEHVADDRWRFKARGRRGATWCYEVLLRRFAKSGTTNPLPIAGVETAFPGIVAVKCRS